MHHGYYLASTGVSEIIDIMPDGFTELVEWSMVIIWYFCKVGKWGGTWPHCLHISHHSIFPDGNGLGAPVAT
jgi:hypothetical protein